MTTKSSLLAGRVPLVLASLLLAVFVWYAINGAISYELQLEDIAIQVVPDVGWSVLAMSSETVDVRFRGAADDMRSLRADDVKVVLDVRGREAQGRLEVPIELGLIGVPNGVKPISVRPESISVDLDLEVERIVAVKVERLGDPPLGYEVEEIICSPAAVTIRGPLQDLDQLKEVRTMPVELADKVRSFSTRIALQAPGGSSAYRIEPEKVTVEITLVERASTTELEAIPVNALLKAGFLCVLSVQPDKVAVILKGPSEGLKELSQAAVRAYADCSGIFDAGQYDLPVRVDTPPGVAVESILPKTVQVDIGGL